MLSRLTGKSTRNPAFLHPRTATTPSRELAQRLRSSGYSIPEPLRLGRFYSQYIDNQGETYSIENASPVRQSKPVQLPASKREEYKRQQRVYVIKIRTALTPRPLSDAFKEFDSTKDNPPNSKSARFGLKPEVSVYQYRLVSWGEAGSGIPLVNNPYSVRPHNAPAVAPDFKRKKFTGAQRDTVRSAPYRQAVQNILNAGLHNSHGLASRFLGPETSANIAPSTFTNNKNKNWGQGEMQSHLEHALFRIESKASHHGVPVFLRCTDYLGKFGELQSRKIKVFLSEAVTDAQLRSQKGNVKEITLGTFYLPGMVSEPDSGHFIKAFKDEVSRLERAADLVLDSSVAHETASLPLEVRYKYGVCAQDLKELSYRKLVHGKQYRTNDGLRPVLQRNPKSIESVVEQKALNRQQEKQQKVFHEIRRIKENPHVLKAGEELWVMDDIETALGHIRCPDLEDHIKAQVDSGQLSWRQHTGSVSDRLSHSSSENSLSSLSTVSSETTQGGKRVFEVEFSDNHQTSDSTFVPSSSTSQTEDSTEKTPAWLRMSSEKKRKPQFD